MPSDTPSDPRSLTKLFRFGDFVLVGAIGSMLGVGILLLINDVQLKRPKRGVALFFTCVGSLFVYVLGVVALHADVVPLIPEELRTLVSLGLVVPYYVLFWYGVNTLYGEEYKRRLGTNKLGRRPLAMLIGIMCLMGMFAAFIGVAKFIHSMGGLDALLATF